MIKSITYWEVQCEHIDEDGIPDGWCIHDVFDVKDDADECLADMRKLGEKCRKARRN